VLGGLNQKWKNNVLLSATLTTDDPKMGRFHRETKKKNPFERAREKALQTDKQTESTTKKR